ncbi:MAG TPA: hypothetical protein VNZ44_17745 [Pyrinomonadaceae bacterium]|nr:hypothetical protein [Pyrinomonadaceae bacterium]
MGRLAAILRRQWTAYARRAFRAGSGRAAGVLVLALGVFIYRYLQLLPKAAAETAAGRTRRLEMLLGGVLLAWLFPLLGEARLGVSTRGLRRFPLTTVELFGIKVISSLMPPYVWLLSAASLALWYPLAAGANPLLGVASLALCLAAAMFAGHALSHLLSVPFWRRLVLFAAGAGLLFVGVRLTTGAGDAWTGAARAGAWSPSSLNPARLVAAAATSTDPLPAAAATALLCAAAVCLALWSFRLSLRAGHTSSPARGRLAWPFGLPGRFGGLVWKEARDFTRLLDFYLSLLVAVWAALYLVYAGEPSPHLIHAALVAVPLLNPSAAFNFFGLETPSGFDRYALLPLSGRDVVVIKNLAFAFLLAAPLCPATLLASWRFGIVEGLFCVLEIALLAAAFLAWGNVASVARPFRMQPFRFSSGGPPVEMLAGAVFGSLPGVWLTYLLYQGGDGLRWKLPLTALACAALYWLSVRKSAASFGRRREELRRLLT